MARSRLAKDFVEAGPVSAAAAPTIHEPHPSSSAEQCTAESMILKSLEREYQVKFHGQPKVVPRVKLDGYADGGSRICVEVWAHQGEAKGSQPKKVMADMAKLVLVERLLGKQCRKVFAACDAECLAFLRNSWMGQFAIEFGIECRVVDVCDTTRNAVRAAQ